MGFTCFWGSWWRVLTDRQGRRQGGAARQPGRWTVRESATCPLPRPRPLGSVPSLQELWRPSRWGRLEGKQWKKEAFVISRFTDKAKWYSARVISKRRRSVEMQSNRKELQIWSSNWSNLISTIAVTAQHKSQPWHTIRPLETSVESLKLVTEATRSLTYCLSLQTKCDLSSLRTRADNNSRGVSETGTNAIKLIKTEKRYRVSILKSTLWCSNSHPGPHSSLFLLEKQQPSIQIFLIEQMGETCN